MSRVGDLNYYSQWNPWQQSDATAKVRLPEQLISRVINMPG